MNTFNKQLIVTLLSGGLILASNLSYAKQTEIGIGAIAIQTSLIGKGKFLVNDTVDEGDSLKTGAEGSSTILFNDESMLILGPEAHASIEVYEEASDGKPGRSVIRIHKGQFRYFPGDILASGGAQFVAVGDKLLGKSATPNPSPIQTNDNASNDNAGNDNAGNDNAGNENAGNENAGNENAGNDDTAQGNDVQPSPEAPVSPEQAIEEVAEINDDAAQEQPQGNDAQPSPDTEQGESKILLATMIPANTGQGNTGEEGGTGGTSQNPLGPQFSQEVPPSNPQPSGGAAASFINGLPSEPQGDSFAVQSQQTPQKNSNFIAFADAGLSGNVDGGFASFRGDVDVFSNAGASISFLGAADASADIGLNIGTGDSLVTNDFQTIKTLPTTQVRTVFSGESSPKIEALNIDNFDVSTRIDISNDVKIDTSTLSDLKDVTKSISERDTRTLLRTR